jgi:hypothetical protein
MIQAMSEITILKSSMLVMGMKIRNPGRAITMSPGSRKRGILQITGQSSPARTRQTPDRIKIKRMLDITKNIPPSSGYIKPLSEYEHLSVFLRGIGGGIKRWGRD